MALRQHQRKRGGLEIPRTTHDERWNRSVGVDPKVFGALVGLGDEIYQASLEGNAKMDQNPVDRQACPARRIIERVNRVPQTGLFAQSGKTQALGKMLAVTFAKEGSGDEVAYRRVGLNCQTLRHQLPSAFDEAQL